MAKPATKSDNAGPSRSNRRHQSQKQKSKKKSKKRKPSFKSYLLKVLQMAHPNMSISAKSMEIMNSLVKDMFEKVALEAGKLTTYRKGSTMTSKDIQSAVRLMFPAELAKYAMNMGQRALVKYNSIQA